MQNLVFGFSPPSAASPLTRHRSPVAVSFFPAVSTAPKPWASRAALHSIMRPPQKDGPSCQNPACSTANLPLDTSMVSVGAVCRSCGQVVVVQRVDDTVAGTTGTLARNEEGFAEDDCHAGFGDPELEDIELSAPVETALVFQDASDDDDDAGAGAGTGADTGISIQPSLKERLAMRNVVRKKAGKKLNMGRLNSNVRRRKITAMRKQETTDAAILDIATVVLYILAESKVIRVVTEARDVLDKLTVETGRKTEKIVREVATAMLAFTFLKVATDRFQSMMVNLLRNKDMFHVYVAMAFFIIAQRTSFDITALTTTADLVRKTMRMKEVASSLSPQRTSHGASIPTTKTTTAVVKKQRDAATVVTTHMLAIIVSCVSIIMKKLEDEHRFSTSVSVASRKAAAVTMAKLVSSPPPRPVAVTVEQEETKKRQASSPLADSPETKKRRRRSAEASKDEDDGPFQFWDLVYNPVSDLTSSSSGCTSGSNRRHYKTVTLAMVTITAPWFEIQPIHHDVTLSVLGEKVPTLVKILQETDKRLGGLAAATPLVKACGGSIASPIHLVVLSALWSVISRYDVTLTEEAAFGRAVVLYYTLVVPEGTALPAGALKVPPKDVSEDVRRKTKDRTCIFDARPIMFTVLYAVSAVVYPKMPTIVSKARDVVVAMGDDPPTGIHGEFASKVLPSLIAWFTLSHKRAQRPRHVSK